jgi:acyl carrier protein
MNDFKSMNVLKIILASLGIPIESLYSDTLVRKDLQLDSTETIEVSLELKRQLGINVKLETREDMTLAQICNLIEVAMLNKHKLLKRR